MFFVILRRLAEGSIICEHRDLRRIIDSSLRPRGEDSVQNDKKRGFSQVSNLKSKIIKTISLIRDCFFIKR